VFPTPNGLSADGRCYPPRSLKRTYSSRPESAAWEDVDQGRSDYCGEIGAYGAAIHHTSEKR